MGGHLPDTHLNRLLLASAGPFFRDRNSLHAGDSFLLLVRINSNQDLYKALPQLFEATLKFYLLKPRRIDLTFFPL